MTTGENGSALAAAQKAMMRAMNRLAKWRVVFTGWQLGTRAKGDAEGDAVRDHREVTLLLRAEVSALTRLVREEVGAERLLRAFHEEYEALDHDLESKFPGHKSADYGMEIDVAKAAETTRHWRP